MPILRRLTLTILSILLLTVIANGLVQPVYAQTTTVTATVVWVNGPKPSIQLQLFCTPTTIPIEVVPGDTLKVLAPGGLGAKWDNVSTVDAVGNPCTFSVKQGSWGGDPSVFTEAPPPDYTPTTSTDGLTITNTYVIPKTGTATATKVWPNGPTIKPTIGFRLYRNSTTVSIQVVPGVDVFELPNDTTSATWTGLETTDLAGNIFKFSVKEGTWNADKSIFSEGPPPYFVADYSLDGLTVTNTFTPTVTTNKIWVGGPTARPTILFKLYRQVGSGAPAEVPVAEAPLKELQTGTTTVSWENQTVVYSDGNYYNFSVREGTGNATTNIFNEGAPTNYQPAYSPDGLTVTNTYKINVIGTKIWSGGPAAKPNIQIQLYRNGTLLGSPYTLTSGFTSYIWNVEQTAPNGATYLYTVDEVTVPAFYSKRVNGMTITNTYTGTLPYTGDNTHNTRWLALLLGLSALLPLMGWLDLKLLTRRRG